MVKRNVSLNLTHENIEEIKNKRIEEDNELVFSVHINMKAGKINISDAVDQFLQQMKDNIKARKAR